MKLKRLLRSCGVFGIALLVLAGGYFRGGVSAVPLPASGVVPVRSVADAVAGKVGPEAFAAQATSRGMRLPSPFQGLEGTVDAEGLTIVSAGKDSEEGAFSLMTASLSRPDGTSERLVARGRVLARDRHVVLDKGAIQEEFSSSVDGVRQDFVIPVRPDGQGPLSLAAEIFGASARLDAGEIRLALDGSGRELAYGKLLVTDARGMVLPARFALSDARAFDIVVDDTAATYPIRIDPTVSDADWQALGTGTDNIVYTVAVDAQNNLYVGGGFITSAGGVSATRIAKWDGTSWSALGSGANAAVNALVVDDADNLYAAGAFDTIGGVSANSIAKWNGSSWSALGSGLNNVAQALAADTAGNVYVGGVFTTAGGSSIQRLAQWNGSSWSGLGTAPNGTIAALAVDRSDGSLYAGGTFTTIGGTNANRIAKWNGSSWSALGTGITGTSVDAVAVASDHSVYAGGAFTAAGGSSAANIAKWNGSSWSALGSGLDGSLLALVTDQNDYVYAGGSFTHAGGQSTPYIAFWNGTDWAGLGSGASTLVRALAVDHRGDLYAGGHFTTIGGKSANYVAFARLFRYLRYSAGSNGTLTGTASQIVDYGADGTAVTAVPDSGFEFTQWSDASSTNPRTDYGVTSSKTLVASFASTGGGNVNPNAPTSLGPADLVNGSVTTTATPTVTFSLSDPDVADTVRYVVQIDDSADFGSPVVSYTSGLAVQGPRGFTVGQAVAAGASYAVGAPDQTLPSGTYYWRVQARDNSGASSAFTVANGGSAAFTTDAVPNVPTSLGQATLTDGSSTGTTNPILRFTLTDPDGSDTLRFQIEMSRASDFSSPIIDYTSALGAQGAQAFQVGQAAGSGAYAAGSNGQTLIDGAYYWRVRAIDAGGVSSTYALARASGLTAFVVDTAARSVQFVPASGTSLESVTATSVRIVLDIAHFQTVTTTYAVTGGTASGSGVDYTLTSGQAVIYPGETSTTIPITISNDAIAEGNETIQITLTGAVNASVGTNGVYTYTIADDDAAGALLSKSSLSVTEGGATDSYTVALASQPTSTVEIMLAPTNGQIAISTSTIAFTSSNWNVPVTVTVQADDDAAVEGPHASAITHAASSTNYGYGPAFSIASVTVNITDNDAAPSSGGGGGGGGGGSGNYGSPFAPTPTTTTSTAPLPPVEYNVTFLEDAPLPAAEPAPVGRCPIVKTEYIDATDRDCLLAFLGITAPDEAAEARALKGVSEDAKEFGYKVYGGQLKLYSLFIAYGVSHQTRALGERERRAAVRDMLQVIGYGATAEDYHRAVTGSKPRTRNLPNEQKQAKQVLVMFQKMYKHNPKFTDRKDDLAWNVMMYRTRFPRDLAVEAAGLKAFRSVFGRNPVSPLDWAAVRALGYIK